MRASLGGLFLALSLFRPFEASGAGLEAQGIVYYDRGHYWIEISFRDEAGRDTMPPDCAAGRFEIVRIGADGSFRPTRVEVTGGRNSPPSAILSTSRIEGRACYRVIFRPATGGIVVADSICDPFAPAGAGREHRHKAFFRRYVASIFRRDGEGGGLNQLSYGYDLSGGRASSSLRIAPRARWRGWSAEADASRDETSVLDASGGKTAASRAAFSASLARSTWASDLRCSLAASCGVDRAVLERSWGDSTVRSRSASIEGRVRLDNLFDRLNRYPSSVCSGVEAAFGYAWHRVEGEGPRGGAEEERFTPYAAIRATWAFLYGFRLSYAMRSFWPSAAAHDFAAFHSVSARLLLGDVLEPPRARSQHPDIELVWETGRRLPLLEREEKLSIGFTFDLYPR